LQLYLSQPRAPGRFEVRQSGDLLPHAAKEVPYRAFAFRVDFADDRPRTAYVRLRTSSSSVLTARAWQAPPTRAITLATCTAAPCTASAVALSAALAPALASTASGS